jgi:hypothetical protein
MNRLVGRRPSTPRPADRRRRRRGAGAARAEPLEPRLLLTAEVFGTMGPDTIRISRDDPSRPDYVHITVDGSINLNINTRDPDIVIRALGGDDAVLLGNLESVGGVRPNLTLDLGDGADLVDNGGDLTFFQSTGRIDAGPGVDTFALDHRFGDDAMRVTVGEAAGGGHAVSVSRRSAPPGSFPPGSLRYDAALENVTLDTGDQADLLTLNAKPAATRLTASGGGGDDTVLLGGGDLDSNGWVNATVSGGAGGGDEITIADMNDLYSPQETEALTLGFNLLTKGGGASVSYTTFERQTVDAADARGGDPFGSRVDLAAVSSSIASTTVLAGDVRPTAVYVGTGNLGPVAGSVDLRFSAAGGSVNVNDENATVARTFDLAAGGFTAPFPIAVSLLPDATAPVPITINAGGADDRLYVRAAAPLTPVVLRGGGGVDTFTLGGGDVAANLRGAVSTFGDAGFGDAVEFDNTAKGHFASGVINGSNYTDGGRTFPQSSVEVVRVFQPQIGGSRLDVRSSPGTIRVVGGGGDDGVVLGAAVGRLETILHSPVTFDGGGGAGDYLTLDDHDSTETDDYRFDTGERFRLTGTFAPDGTVTTPNVELRTLRAGRYGTTITVNGTLSDLAIDAGDGNDTVTVPDATGLVTVDTGPEAGTVNSGDVISVNADFATAGDTPATVRLARNDKVRSLFVRPRGTLQIPDGAALLVTNDATVQGVIDLAGGALILDGPAAPTPAAAAAWLRAGLANGAWTGTSPTDAGAIHSSLAAATAAGDGVGFAPAAGLFATFPAPFAGHAVTAAAVLFRHTLTGDATLDRAVDFNDLVKLAQSYDTAGRFYFQGDFNYDDLVDFNDLVSLAQNYNTAMPAAASATVAAPTAAPAPRTAAAPASQSRREAKLAFSTALVARPVPRPAPRPAAGARR